MGCFVDRAAMLWVYYCVTFSFLMDRADMLWVFYCLSMGCLLESAAILWFFTVYRGLFSGQGS
jgi:hypothetical protein